MRGEVRSANIALSFSSRAPLRTPAFFTRARPNSPFRFPLHACHFSFFIVSVFFQFFFLHICMSLQLIQSAVLPKQEVRAHLAREFCAHFREFNLQARKVQPRGDKSYLYLSYFSKGYGSVFGEAEDREDIGGKR